MQYALASLLAILLLACAAGAADTPRKAGATGPVGARPDAKTVHRLEITKPGVYENLVVDGRWAAGNLVKITASDVTLRNCEIHSGAGNGVGVFAPRVVIENCRIHHMLAGSFAQQQDAHGITGRWGDVVIRNCEIHHTSGDSVQFDPDRKSRGRVLIENCTFWTGPLPEDAAGFKRGETPGENAFDSKTPPDGERCRIVIRDSHLHGWQQPGQIDNMAALNLKENIHAVVEGCVFQRNEIALRVRGPGKRGGALVEVKDCAIYDCETGVRMEDRIENLTLNGLAFGGGVKRKYREVGDGPWPGLVNEGERKAPPISELVTAP